MLYYAYYVIRPKNGLLNNPNLDSELREILSEPTAFRNPQGGRTAWSSPDYHLLVKLFFLAEMRKQYGGSFLCDSPHSATFFDQWWDLEIVPEGLDREELVDQFEKEDFQSVDCGNNQLVRSYLDQFPFKLGGDADAPLERQYRIYFEKDVVGWLKEPKQKHATEVHGVWSGTTNPRGREISKTMTDGQEYEVILEGPSMIRGKIRITGGKAVFELPTDWL